jgi:hypothetical protein
MLGLKRIVMGIFCFVCSHIGSSGRLFVEIRESILDFFGFCTLYYSRTELS